jgi:hypothetical protein
MHHLLRCDPQIPVCNTKLLWSSTLIYILVHVWVRIGLLVSYKKDEY